MKYSGKKVKNDPWAGLHSFIGLICILTLPGLAQVTTLSSMLLTAQRTNPMILAARSDVEAKDKQIRIAPTLPDPTISSGYFISPVETRVGPQRGRIGISQMVPWPEKLIQKKKIAQKEYAVSQEALREVEARIFASIRQLYNSYYALGREIAITKDNLKILQQMESVLLSQYAAAKITQLSVLKVQIEITVLDDQLKSLNAEGVKMREKLYSLVNDSSVKNLDFPSELPHLPIPRHIDTLIALVRADNPSMSKARFGVAAASEQLKLSRLGFAPDFMFMSDYIFTEKSLSPMADPKENGKNPWIVGASVTLPLWAGSKHAQIEKAEAMEKMLGAALTNSTNVAIQNITTQIEEYHDALRKCDLYEKNLIPQANQSVALVEESYINGKVSILDYLDAQRTLLKLEITYEKQRSRVETVAAEIDQLFGGRLTRQELGI